MKKTHDYGIGGALFLYIFCTILVVNVAVIALVPSDYVKESKQEINDGLEQLDNIESELSIVPNVVGTVSNKYSKTTDEGIEYYVEMDFNEYGVLSQRVSVSTFNNISVNNTMSVGITLNKDGSIYCIYDYNID